MDNKAFRKLSYGLYIVSSKQGDKLNGQIANTAFQITSDPATIAVSINKGNLTHEFIQKSKVFALSILAQTADLKTIGHFGFKSGREIDKFQEISYKNGTTGVPVELEQTVGYFEAEVINSVDVGTHTVFIGKVLDAKVIDDGEPMTYAYYHLLKQGKAPQATPEQPKVEKEASKKTTSQSRQYVCQVCGYIYNPEEGDPDGGILPGTPFEEIPEDWVCPVCGVGKDQFEPA